MKQVKIIAFIVSMAQMNFLYAPLNFNANSSFLKISEGGTFFSDGCAQITNGKLFITRCGGVEGSDITFDQGILEHGGRFELKGILRPEVGIFLTGGGSLLGLLGEVDCPVYVSGQDNRIEGFVHMAQNLILTDSTTTVTFSIQSALNTVVVLNGGTVTLEDDLVFADGYGFYGSGIINVEGYRIYLSGEDVVTGNNLTFNNANDLTLNGNLTVTGVTIFNGQAHINGNGFVYDLTQGGEVVIGDNTTLYVSDICVKGLGTDYGKITFSSDTSELVLTNVDVELKDSVVTWSGAMYVEGPTTFILKDNDWTFAGTSSLTVDGVTLWKDQAGAATLGDITGDITLINDGIILGISWQEAVASLESRLDVLESFVDYCCDAMSTSTWELQSQIDELVEDIAALELTLDSRVDLLESCCDEMRTSTWELQSQIDDLVTTIDTLDYSVDSRLDSLESCCDAMSTSTWELQSQIDDLATTVDTLDYSVDSRLDSLESCCDVMSTSTWELQSQIDDLATTVGTLDYSVDSRLDLLESCCDAMSTNTWELQSQIDDLATTIDTLDYSVDSRLDYLESCCDSIVTNTGEYQSQIDELATAIDNLEYSVDSRLDLLESCCDVVQSEIDELFEDVSILDQSVETIESRVDVLSSKVDYLDCGCSKQYCDDSKLKLNLNIVTALHG